MALSLADIEALQSSGTLESVTLEYKAKVDTEREGVTKLAAEVCAFANARGGLLLIGVREKNVCIEEITGMREPDPDTKCLQYAQILESHIEPKLRGLDVYSFPAPTGAPVFVIEVQRGLHGPYRVRKNKEFYLRRSAAKVPMEYTEIRDHFRQVGDVYTRIGALISDRLDKIDSRDTPRLLVQAPTFSIHVVPIDVVETIGGMQISFLDLRGREMEIRFLPPGGSDNSSEYNLLGRCTYNSASNQDETRSYCQLFREGYVEGVVTYLNWAESKTIPSSGIHKTAYHCIRTYLASLEKLGATYPFVVSLALTGIADFDLGVGNSGTAEMRYGSRPIIPPMGVRPGPIVIEAADADIFEAILPIFDQIWNTFGYEYCPYRSVDKIRD